MVAVSVTNPGTLAIKLQTEFPPYGPGEVVLRVARAGICGADIHILHGSNSFARYPRVIGQEFAGTTIAAGSGVAALQPG